MKQTKFAQIWIVLIGLITVGDSGYLYGMEILPEDRFGRIKDFLNNAEARLGPYPTGTSQEINTFLDHLAAVQAVCKKDLSSSLSVEFDSFILNITTPYASIFNMDIAIVTDDSKKKLALTYLNLQHSGLPNAQNLKMPVIMKPHLSNLQLLELQMHESNPNNSRNNTKYKKARASLDSMTAIYDTICEHNLTKPVILQTKLPENILMCLEYIENIIGEGMAYEAPIYREFATNRKKIYQLLQMTTEVGHQQTASIQNKYDAIRNSTTFKALNLPTLIIAPKLIQPIQPILRPQPPTLQTPATPTPQTQTRHSPAIERPPIGVYDSLIKSPQAPQDLEKNRDILRSNLHALNQLDPNDALTRPLNIEGIKEVWLIATPIDQFKAKLLKIDELEFTSVKTRGFLDDSGAKHIVSAHINEKPYKLLNDINQFFIDGLSTEHEDIENFLQNIIELSKTIKKNELTENLIGCIHAVINNEYFEGLAQFLSEHKNYKSHDFKNAISNIRQAIAISPEIPNIDTNSSSYNKKPLLIGAVGLGIFALIAYWVYHQGLLNQTPFLSNYLQPSK